MQLSRILLIIGAVGVALGIGVYLSNGINSSVTDDGDKGKEVKAELKPAAGTSPRASSDRNLSSQPSIAVSEGSGCPTGGTGCPAVEEVVALRKEVERLGAEVNSLRQEWRMQGRAKAPVGEAGGETAQDLQSEMNSHEEEDQRLQERMQTVEAKFQGEAVDPGWSNQAIGVLGQALTSAELAGTAVRNMECRTQTCRVEVAFTDPAQLSNFIFSFPQKVAQIAPNTTINQINEGGGKTTVIFYLTREGFEP